MFAEVARVRRRLDEALGPEGRDPYWQQLKRFFAGEVCAHRVCVCRSVGVAVHTLSTTGFLWHQRQAFQRGPTSLRPQ